MDVDQTFSLASSAAAASWLALILLPRWRWIIAVLRFGVILALSVLYATLIFTSFFSVEGGGYGSLDQVAALFSNRTGLLAGWVHYLAFDLLIGVWIAERADARGVSRIIQAPILLATFMFGPIGYLIHASMEALPQRRKAASVETGQ